MRDPVSYSLRLRISAVILLVVAGHNGIERVATAQTKTKGATKTARVQRTREEVNALIEKEGRTPPPWFAAAQLNYPKTLDLAWDQPPPGTPWNPQKNIGQFVWDIINPNPGRWGEGVKFMHELLRVHKDDPEKLGRVMNTLGIMYHNLHEDYARAAFWWRKAGAEKQPESEYPRSGVHLAECYYLLGNKEMAVELLQRLPDYWSAIKLWADMGEIDKALKLCEDEIAKPDGEIASAYLMAGDVCRTAGRYQDALAYYQKLVTLKFPGQPTGWQNRCINRARASIEAIKVFELSDVTKVPDGVYKANSIGYEAQVFVEVTVKNKRIEAVNVTQHREKQFYSALTDTPRKIIDKQSVKGVDATSNATITSEAIINSTAKALAAAVK